MARYKLRECPGCNKPVNMPAGKLCWECNAKLVDYDRMQKLTDRGREEKLLLYGFCGEVPLPLASGFDKDAETTQRLREALERLIDGLSPVVEGENTGHLLSSRRSHDGPTAGMGRRQTKSFKASFEFSEAYGEFVFSLASVINTVYQNGQRQGQSLLQQLNNGRLSTYDFDERREGRRL